LIGVLTAFVRDHVAAKGKGISVINRKGLLQGIRADQTRGLTDVALSRIDTKAQPHSGIVPLCFQNWNRLEWRQEQQAASAFLLGPLPSKKHGGFPG
jgi:hypothetical protein